MIFVDTREKPRAITKIIKFFDEHGIKHVPNKLYCGDYQAINNSLVVVDRKADLAEICGNVTQQHERFKAELVRAMDAGIKIYIVCEHGRGITSLESVKSWSNPRLKVSPKATTGEQLYKSLCTIRDRYNVTFVFCTKNETGKVICDILGEPYD